MIVKVSIPADSVTDYAICFATIQDQKYPVLSIERGSYLSEVSVQSGINLHFEQNLHNLQFGKYTSVAHDVNFNMDLNHDYKSIVMGRVPELKNLKCDRLKRKGEILIGNDVWIGAGATIMGGGNYP